MAIDLAKLREQVNETKREIITLYVSDVKLLIADAERAQRYETALREIIEQSPRRHDADCGYLARQALKKETER